MELSQDAFQPDVHGTFFAGINFLKHDSNDGEIRLRTKVAGSNTDVVTIVDGRVGINDVTPVTKLVVRDTLQAAANNHYSFIIKGDDNGTNGESAHIFLSAIDASTRGVAIGAELRSTSNNHDLVFKTSNISATPTEKLRITNTGDVGIGVTNPTSFGPTLQVSGTDPALLLQDTATAVDYFGVNVTSGITQLWYDDAAAFTINTATGISGSGLAERFRIASNGNTTFTGGT